VKQDVREHSHDQRPDDRHAVEGARGHDSTEWRVKDIRQVTNERDKPGIPPRVKDFEYESHRKKSVENAEKIVNDACNAADDSDTSDFTWSAAAAENRRLGFNDVGMHLGKESRRRARQGVSARAEAAAPTGESTRPAQSFAGVDGPTLALTPAMTTFGSARSSVSHPDLQPRLADPSYRPPGIPASGPILFPSLFLLLGLGVVGFLGAHAYVHRDDSIHADGTPPVSVAAPSPVDVPSVQSSPLETVGPKVEGAIAPEPMGESSSNGPAR
jgi:hypothetical protein